MNFDKRENYYKGLRKDLINLLPKISGSFLEIGCGDGSTLEYLKSHGAKFVAGIDIEKQAVRAAAGKKIDCVILSDIEKDKIPFDKKGFDCIILADVLEHLYNPWQILKKLTKYLKANGYVLLSIPNIKNYKVLRDLIMRDKWEYTSSGILDNTHLRFFTFREIKKMLNEAGFKIIKIKWRSASGIKFKILNALFLNKLQSFTVVQYLILAQRK